MMRRAFLGFCGLCVAGLSGVVTAKMSPIVGPAIELRFNPVAIYQSLPDSVERTADNRLCWKRRVTKLRDAAPWNFDVFLDRPWSHDRSFPEVRDHYTREPWHTSAAIRAGQIKDRDQCVGLPDDLEPGEPIVLTQTIHYPGFHGWWDLPVPLPTISYTVPGEPSHDRAPVAPDTSPVAP